MPSGPFISPAFPSPWLITFEDSIADRIHNPVSSPSANNMYQGRINQNPDDFFSRNEVPKPPEITLTPTTPRIFPTALPQGTLEGTIAQRRFFAIAARAYQEAVKLPEEPPEHAWTSNDPCHSYYQAILQLFGTYFRQILEQQGRYEEIAFRAELEVHARNIMENVRVEWGIHPMGSTASIRTLIRTENSPAAVIALEYVIRKPLSPPAAEWTVNDPLHPYYERMLDRFHEHLQLLLREHGMSLFEYPIDIQEATDSFVELIIREYREMWISMFGL